MPKRIQRRCSKGWKMPANAVYVGRPTEWGNPFPLDVFGREEAMRKFRGLFENHDAAIAAAYPVDRVAELRGKDLACWCPLTRACHADVLLERANAARRP